MNLSLQTVRDVGATVLWDRAGILVTVYRQLTTATGASWAGGGMVASYATARATAIWAAPGNEAEMRQPGGQVIAGQEVIYCLSQVGTADRVGIGSALYEVAQEPYQARVEDGLYWRVVLKRG